MPDKIRWGVISTARIGRRHVIPAIQASRNGEVRAVASRTLDKAKAFAEELNIAHAYGSYEELIADPDIDAIYNPLPNHLHAEWSLRCAEAGRPTLCEKPLAADAAEAQTMVDAFAARGVLFAEAFMYRFHPRAQRVREMVAEGAVGEVQLMQASFSFRVRSEDNIRLRKDMAGGALMDVGCYCVNVMRFVTGEEPERVRAAARFGPTTGVDEWLVGALSFPSGALGHFDCGLRAHRAESYEIRGSEGSIVVEDAFVVDPDTEAIIQYWHESGHEEITLPPVDQYQLMVEDFADALMEGRPPAFPPQDAVRNMAVIDRLLTSARQ
jgi:xylose dehydrogenase (NAD/NADP)